MSNIKCKNNIWCSLFILMFVFVFSETRAQELLLGLSENVLPYTPKPIKTRADVGIGLPFIDDFSKQGQVVPNPKLWLNSQCIFVNNTYGINSPTIGVATFDPFDSKGKIYKNASSSVFAADSLTSAPIWLEYLPSDSVYLSFYFQPQGYGDMPEQKDSLTLEFYSPEKDRWINVWSASVISETEILLLNHISDSATTVSDDSIGYRFFRVDINISDPDYLKDRFAFRFVNYASINIHPAFPGRSTASDHWHIDFVYLDKNRTIANTNLPDIALIGQQQRLIQNYESVPATHLEFANDLFENPMIMQLNYKNLGWGIKSVTRNFSLRSIYGAGKTLLFSAGAENIGDGQTIDLFYPVTPSYEFAANDDSASFEFLSWIVTDNDPEPLRTALRNNDTNRVIYQFRDYYAYDDGTAENGYGLFGNGSSNGQVAVKYHTYMADSLRGVYMYFNRAVNDVNANNKFIVAVWDDADGVPGNIIHKETGGSPIFKDSLNKFVAYKFEKPILLSKGEIFYVGWLQTDEGFINIGFDRNRNSKDKTFYNLGQNWESSVFDGTLMMRPIFCSSEASFPSDREELENDKSQPKTGSFTAYPNPVRSGVVYLDEEDNMPVKSPKIELFALSGELVKVFQNVTGNVDVTVISPGLYLMRVWDTNNRIREVKRIIIAK